MNITKTHAICQLAVCPLRSSATDESEIVSHLVFGEYVTVLSDSSPWVRIKNHADGYVGWMDFKQLKFITESEFLKGVKKIPVTVGNSQLKLDGPHGLLTVFLGASLPFYDGEKCMIGDELYFLKDDFIKASIADIPTLCSAYLNAPYLWGGKSLFGIDCSGLTQNIFKAIGVQVPRDAYQQAEFGKSITWDKRQIHDIVFLTTSTKKVTHVGILVGLNEIIHAHGRVRIDSCDQTGIFNKEQDKYTHSFHSIKRWI